MAEIIMPKMGDAMTEGKVIRWYKKAGDVVKKGEPVLEIETDKVNLDLEAEEDGVLEEITVAEGTMAPVGGHLANIGPGGAASAKKPPEAKDAGKKDAAVPAVPASEKKTVEAVPVETKPVTGKPPQAKDSKEAQEKPSPKSAGAEAQNAPAAAADGAGDAEKSAAAEASPEPASRNDESGERRRSSPLARRMARDLGLSIETMKGSGPAGRVVASDVKRMQDAPAASASQTSSSPASSAAQPSTATGKPEARFVAAGPLADQKVPLTAMRRTIAKRLSESTGPIPHFFLTVDYDVTALLAVRDQLGEIAGSKPSVNDFIVRAAALALHHHPYVNASFAEDAIELHGQVHIGIAVSTPEGLLTPVVRNADQKSVTDIAAEVRGLADKARNRKLKPDEYQGSTFTISNLGAWGIEDFTAIIDPPNVAILAVGAAAPRTVVVDRQIVIRDRMKLTMSCDHRVVDGALGAEYLKTLRQYIEQPLRLIL
jgi:pyruvate dehydrogenase E2 component (dihydrolipoamide acetyltransferase)